MSWLSWIFFGALAGWVASLVLRDKQRGCLTNMVTGILGAVLAGFIYRWATGVPWNFGWDWAELRGRLPGRARPAAGDQSGHQEHAARG